MGTYRVASETWDVVVSGNYAYNAVWDAGLSIVNISDPTNPTLAGRYDTPGYAIAVFVDGYYAYVADGVSGLQIIGVYYPNNPVFVGSYDTPFSAYGVWVSGNYAYVADVTTGLVVLNVADPTNPTLVSTFDTQNARSVYVDGNYAYISDGFGGLLVIDVSDPANPGLDESYDTPWFASSAAVIGDNVFVADYHSVLVLNSGLTGIKDDSPRIPGTAFLFQNYPNPFNAQTTIQYSLPRPSTATIDVFDLLGRRVVRLAEGTKPAGNSRVVWDAGGQSSGIYFYRLKAGDKVESKKMVLMK